MKEKLDFRELFGEKYKIGYDPASGHAETFKAVAQIARAEKKRKISEKKRQELAEQSRKNANYRPQEEGSGFYNRLKI